MNKVIKALRGFVGRIQNSDDAVKRRWWIALSSVSCAFIVFLWIGYTSLTIRRPEPPTRSVVVTASPREEVTANVSEAGEGRFGGVMRRVARGGSRLVALIRDLFTKTNSIEIQGEKSRGATLPGQ